MAVSIKELTGAKSVEEQKEENRFILDWEDSKRPRLYDDTGSWYYADLTIAEAVLYHFGDELTTEHIPTLQRILELDTALTEEERAFIDGLITAIEEDAKKAPAPPTPTTEPQPEGKRYTDWLAECWREWNSLEWVEIDAYTSERLPMGARVRAYMEGKDKREALEFLRVVADTWGSRELATILDKEEAKLNQQPTTAPTETPALRSELDKARATIQAQSARISELEALLTCTPVPTETTAPDEEEDEGDEAGGAGRKGLHGLSCTQCMDAFALLLEEATGVPLLIDGEIPRGDNAQAKALVELYSMVSGKSLGTCKSYTRQRKTPKKQTIDKGGKEEKAKATIREHLQALKMS